MALYMTQVTYTAESWQSLVAQPVDRSKAVGKACRALGGKLVGLWFAFGDCDVIVITEFPDQISAAALLIAVAAGGSCSSSKTTALMSAADAMEAMAKAGGTAYKPVGG